MTVAFAHTVRSLPARSRTAVISPRRQALDDFRRAFPAELATVPLVQQAFTDVERAVARGMSTTPALAGYCNFRRGVRRLHDGGSAEIARVTSPGGVAYAVKFFKTTEPVAFFQALNEARLLARQLGIMPRFYELGVASTGRPYLLQEWVSGGSLQAVCKTAFNWPLHWQLRSVRAVISAVAVAHSGGLIHRDICPENMMWTDLPQRGGRPLLIDYGVSILRADSGPDVTEPDRAAVRLLLEWARRSHAIDFFSPHLPLDDVYALGLTLYEYCGGNRDDINALGEYARSGGVTAPSAVAALARSQRGGNALGRHAYHQLPDLHELLCRATAVSPSLRYPDAGAMLRDFDARFPEVTDDDQSWA